MVPFDSEGTHPMARDVGNALIGLDHATTTPDRWPLVGRANEIALLKASISGRRGAVIIGPSGVGKTVLATVGIEFARDLGMAVALVGGTEAAQHHAFGAFAPPLHRDSDLVGPESHADQLRRYMHELLDDAGQRPLLVFVDDAHLLDDDRPLSSTSWRRRAQQRSCPACSTQVGPGSPALIP